MTAPPPRLWPARLTLTLTDGRSVTRATEGHRGDCNQPFAESELREKFRELSAVALTPAGVTAVEHAADRVDDWETLAVSTELCRRHHIHLLLPAEVETRQPRG